MKNVKLKSKIKTWRKVKLEKVVDIVYGKDLPTRELKNQGFPVYGGNGIIGYSDKYLYDEPQIIVGCRGAYSGNVFETKPKSFITHNSLILQLKNSNSIDRKFLFYKLLKANIKSTITGSAQPQITITELNQLEIATPNIEKQKRIAKILSAFDEKIELNNKINQTLEEMAQTIFKEWLSKNQKLNIKNQKLGDLMSLRKEKFKKYEEWKSLKLLDLGRFPQKSLAITTYGKGEEIKTAGIKFKKGDILFGAVRPYFHKVVIAPFDGVTNSSVFVIMPKKENHYALLITILFSENTINYTSMCASGTKMPVLKWEDLCNMEVLIPGDKVIDNFNKRVKNFYDLIVKNALENQKLAALRDLLLPKLMSGEILVNSEE